jgi:hypothetical protein
VTNINIWKTDPLLNPIATTNDSVYGVDIDSENSNTGTFFGNILTLFNDYQTEIVDNSDISPKWFEICFKRPICSDKIVLCSKTNNFSNVKITFLDASNSEIRIIDDSDNDEKYHCKDYHFTPLTFIKIKIEFYTTDGVTIAGICLNKTLHVSAQLSGVKTDDGNLVVEGVVKVKDTSNQIINPATEDKQDEIINKLILKDYITNDIDDYSIDNVMYIGKEKKDGTWFLLKIDMTNGTIIRGATEINNPTYTTYIDAWADRTILTYSYLREVL